MNHGRSDILLRVTFVYAMGAVACSGTESSLSVLDGGQTGGMAGTGGATAAGGAGGTGGLTTSGGAGGAGAAGGVSASGGANAGGANTGGKGSLGGLVCPGTQPPPSGYPICRKATDCPTGYSGCDFTPSAGCGICRPPPASECESDGECGAGRICEPNDVVISCLCYTPATKPNRCVPSCATAGCPGGGTCQPSGRCRPPQCDATHPCPTGRTCAPARPGADAYGCAPADCNVDDYQCPAGFRCQPGQLCVPISCSEGYDCPPNYDCTPGSGQPHDCVRRSCTTDPQCDCGACINGVCQDRLFVCSMLVP